MADDIVLEIPGHGKLRGTKCGTSACRFLNVPYALPPTGSRRWERPVPLPDDYVYSTAEQPRDCTKFGGLCPQPDYIMTGGTNMSAVPGATVSICRFGMSPCLLTSRRSTRKTASSSISGCQTRALLQTRRGLSMSGFTAVGCRWATRA